MGGFPFGFPMKPGEQIGTEHGDSQFSLSVDVARYIYTNKGNTQNGGFGDDAP